MSDHFKVRLDFTARHLVLAAVIMPQRTCDLLSQPVVQSIDQIPDMIRHIAEMQILPLAITGIEDLLERLGDLDHRVDAGERTVPQMIDRRDLVISVHDPIHQIGEQLLLSNVCRHHACLPRNRL